MTKTVEELTAIMRKHGVCTTCGDMIEHHCDEPFASCKCGTGEWTEGFTPYQKLQFELAVTNLKLKALLVTNTND